MTAPASPPPRQRLRRQRTETRAEMTVMVRTLIRALLPIALLYGAYIITYGHLTPGGGFQGGLILVGAVVSFYLAYGYDVMRRFGDEELDVAEHIGALLYVVVGIVGLLLGATFLANVFRGGVPGTLISGGIVPVLNFVVAFKVAAGTLIVLVILIEALRKGD